MGADADDSMCGKCGKEIEGKAMKAKDVLYHEEGCFVCCTCDTDLRQTSVYSKEGKLYCEHDYKSNFVPKCAKCMEYILENCVKAMEKTWHSHHFSCYTCDKRFSEEVGYHIHEEKPYCEGCYIDLAVPKCKGCTKPILDKALNALGGTWHLTCFVCKECKKTFEGQSNFYTVDDMPICGPCAGVQNE